MEGMTQNMTVTEILARLALTMFIGGLIGYERRLKHKTIGIGGMMLVALGSTSYMLLGRHISAEDASSLSRTLQGVLQGIGFLGGAVIFRGGTDVRGIKTAAAIWITGATGLAIGTGLWWLGLTVGMVTAAVLLMADVLETKFPRQEEAPPERLPDKSGPR
jgi:putative Mg2+ transporter-C (MgtC) family protein